MYYTKPKIGEFDCTGCVFVRKATQASNKGNDMCSAPNIEPYRSCMKDKVVFIND